MKRIVLCVLLLSINTWMYAQNTLTREHNMLRGTDKFTMQEVTFPHIWDEGEGVVWDISDCQRISDYMIRVKNRNDNNYNVESGWDMYGMYFCNDTLLERKYESRLKTITFTEPKLRLVFPFRYGDECGKTFSGYGTYCEDHHIFVEGQTTINADGEGALILSEGDTLRNALRVYSLTTASMAMDMDSASLDTALLKQEVEERYDWYVKGHRYPLFTTIQRTSYSDCVPVASTSHAYRLLPDEEQYNDSINENVALQDSLLHERQILQENIIHYTVSNEGNQLFVSYTLDKDASVLALVTNANGVLYDTQRQVGKKNEHYSFDFDCSNFPRGHYILYINVNGMVYSEKVTL